MRHQFLLSLLEEVRTGLTSPRAAAERLSQIDIEDTGFARIDHHRSLRIGMPEVIYAAGKSPEQVAEIFFRISRSGETVLATRASEDAWAAVQRVAPEAHYCAEGNGPGAGGDARCSRVRRYERSFCCGRGGAYDGIHGRAG
jgi:NCAIR mutase (PurE)-related protein